MLLDKDGIIGEFPEPSERSYLPSPPTAKAFADCCNEFWWVSIYVAKALWRGQKYNANHLLDRVMREQLMKCLDWYFGMKTDFKKNPGKQGTNYSRYLDEDTLEVLEETYTGIKIEEMWHAFSAMCELFRNTSREIAYRFDLRDPDNDYKKLLPFLENIRLQPPRSD